MLDLAVIVVSTNEAHWLRPCLGSVLAHQGECSLEIVVADNESTDRTAEIVGEFSPTARTVRCANRGFAHANNRALLTTSSRYVLFLNPDTEVVEGTFGELVAALDERPDTGLAGVRQLTPGGELYPTIRRFPGALRALGNAVLPESLPGRPGLLGERVLDPAAYDRESSCDWTSGSFMLARREALESGGYMDERFFIYSEEPDLCLRMKQAGWHVRHLPLMTIVHHAGKAGASRRMAAQDAYARRQYARKHFSAGRRAAYVSALGLGYLVRAVAPRGDGARRAASWAAFRALVGADGPPFGEPPPRALAVRGEDAET